MNMTKQDLIEKISTTAGTTKAEAQRLLDAILESIKGTLTKGGKVTLTGFGTFEVRHRKARKGRNPQSGEPIDIPAMDTPAFKAGKSLKEAVK